MIRKSLYIIVLLVLCSQIGISQSEKIERVEFNGEEYLLYPEFHGVTEWNYSLSYWKENIIRRSYKLDRNEKIDGKWIQFYEMEERVPAKIFSLKNGKVDNQFLTFYKDGNLESDRNYEQENLFDLSVSWFQNGMIKDSTVYRLDTAQNGHVFSNKTFRVAYYENGSVRQIEKYDNRGVKNGNWLSYYENGKVRVNESYSNKVNLRGVANTNGYGARTGEFTYYYENGQVRFQLKYQNDKIVNDNYCEYYEGGGQKECGPLRNGLRLGEWKSWYKNGELKSIGNFKNNDYIFCGVVPYTYFYEYKIGIWHYYYENGQLMCKGEYEISMRNIGTNCEGGADLFCGSFTSEWVGFNENGEVVQIKKLVDEKAIEDQELLLERFYLTEDI
jgi:antitoxin component YwqK of YwqJK toxin-antitoxin module